MLRAHDRPADRFPQCFVRLSGGFQTEPQVAAGNVRGLFQHRGDPFPCYFVLLPVAELERDDRLKFLGGVDLPMIAALASPAAGGKIAGLLG